MSYNIPISAISLNSSGQLVFGAPIASGVVSSITGTASQVIASASSGAITLSLPQSIATFSSPTFSHVTSGVTIPTSSTNLAFYGSSGVGNNITFQAPATITSTQTYVLPLAQGAANTALITDGSGNLSWSQAIGTASSPTFAGLTSSSIIRSDGGILISPTSGLSFSATTSGTISFDAPAGPLTSYSLVLPAAQGAANSILQNDGSGNLYWVSLNGTSDQISIIGVGSSGYTVALTSPLVTPGNVTVTGTVGATSLATSSLLATDSSSNLTTTLNGTGVYALGQTNIALNGGMEIWQRGTTFNSTTNGTYTADRWKNTFAGTITVNVTQESSTIHDGQYSMKIVVSASSSGGNVGINQLVENYLDYAGKTITFSLWVNTTLTNVELFIADGVGTTFGTTSSGSGAWQQLTVTRTLSASATFLAIGFNQSTNNVTGTIYVDSAMCVIGSQPVNFVPRPYQQELSLCQRYFTKFGGSTATTIIGTGQCFSTTQVDCPLRLPVTMRTSPTVTINNATNFQVTNITASLIACTTLSASAISSESFELDAAVASGLVSGNASVLYSKNTNATIFCDAEL